MTLVAVSYFKDGFWALSDSRASHKPRDKSEKITDRFTKTFLLGYRFTSGSSDGGYTFEVTGRIGFAFAGDILAALAIQAMVGNLLENMHDADEKCRTPNFQTIMKVFLRAAELLNEETLVNPRPYEAFIFGFCPTSNEAKLGLLTLKKNQNGIFDFVTQDLILSDGMTYSIGSGAPFFRELISRPESKAKNLENLFHEAVANNPDAGTGGAVQLMSVYRDKASYEGVLQADKTKDNVEIYVSGVGNAEFGEVDGYKLGRVVVGISSEEVINRQELRRLGYDPNSSEVTQGIKNMAAFLFGVRAAASTIDGKLRIDETFELETPRPVKGNFYFSAICTHCFLMTPLLADSTKGKNKQLFSGNGKVHAKCIHCGNIVYLQPDQMLGREWK